jgi:hypothetical protein
MNANTKSAMHPFSEAAGWRTRRGFSDPRKEAVYVGLDQGFSKMSPNGDIFAISLQKCGLASDPRRFGLLPHRWTFPCPESSFKVRIAAQHSTGWRCHCEETDS